MDISEMYGRFKALFESINNRAINLDESYKLFTETADQMNESTNEVVDALTQIQKLVEISLDEDEGQWMTTSDLAEWLKVDKRTVSRWEKDGEIVGYRMQENSHPLFDRNEILKALKSKKSRMNDFGLVSITVPNDIAETAIIETNRRKNLIPIVPFDEIQDYDETELVELVQALMTKGTQVMSPSDESLEISYDLAEYAVRKLMLDLEYYKRSYQWPAWVPKEFAG